MIKNTSAITAPLIAIIMTIAHAASGQVVTEPQNVPAEWSQPYEPFQIVGNLYYVGTYDLASYLITTPKGHILINTGLASSAPVIKEHVESLGFKFSDIKILTTTQAHFDHMGAMAVIKKMTGASLQVDEKDAEVMGKGGATDYALGGKDCLYQPVIADRLLKNMDKIKLGGVRLVMLHHPGHTKGSCSFLFDVKGNQRTYRVLIANMPTIVTEKEFSELSTYPDIEKDYAYTLESMKNLSFDVWVASHASQFSLHDKRQPGATYNPAAFMDKPTYDVQLADLQKAFMKKIEGKK
jgi:metallo-beta-lactamase class B